MEKFVLMQEPSLPCPENKKSGYWTIGLKNLYPLNGFAKCDEFGVTDWLPYKLNGETGNFAFLDEESREAFKGETKVENGITFGIVTLTV